ncbi:DUF2564 family protein [Anaerobacillus sp. HL2]|nr:DUF2564 family protein [Anaerobacillus sp. HL2]
MAIKAAQRMVDEATTDMDEDNSKSSYEPLNQQRNNTKNS